MIKTEHGELIEPRKGDIVMNKGVQWTVTQTELVGDGKLRLSNPAFDDNCKCPPQYCTLLHRPGSPELNHSEWKDGNDA